MNDDEIRGMRIFPVQSLVGCFLLLFEANSRIFGPYHHRTQGMPRVFGKLLEDRFREFGDGPDNQLLLHLANYLKPLHDFVVYVYLMPFPVYRRESFRFVSNDVTHVRVNVFPVRDTELLRNTCIRLVDAVFFARVYPEDRVTTVTLT